MKKRKRKLDKVKLVKEMARNRIGQVPPTKRKEDTRRARQKRKITEAWADYYDE